MDAEIFEVEIMESIKELYKIGSGPSSSHTIAPQRAMKLYMESNSNANRFIVELYGSLSLTGKGHFTDHAIKMVCNPFECDVVFKTDWSYSFPSGLIIKGYDHQQELDQWVVYSLGGGSIKILNRDYDFQKAVYPEKNLSQIKEYCNKHNITYYDYCYQNEPGLYDYLATILESMFRAINRGLTTEGYLLGPLDMPRIAKKLNENAKLSGDSIDQRNSQLLVSYAYANMEENGTLGEVVTAPTCGASGIVSSCLYHYHFDLGHSKQDCINALATAGIFGNVIKKNATISGAIGGCQAEVGAGCAMAAAAISQLINGSLDEIEYAAEIAIEHHLGLTCDPVGGYVIIPCIERNGVASLRARDAAYMSKSIVNIKKPRVSFDDVVDTMNYTGEKIAIELKETSLGGLANVIKIGHQ